MSIEAMAIALHHSRATGTARVVLIGIANHDGDGGAWPAVATLMKYAGGIDRRAVQRALTKLEELGEIRRVISQGGDHSTADHLRPNLYRFLLDCPHDCDRTKNHHTRRSAPLQLPDALHGAVIRPRAVETPPAVEEPGEGAVIRPPKPSSKPLITPALKTALDAHARNEEALERCPFRPSGQPHVYAASTGECAHCGIREDQYWDGKDIRNRELEPTA